MQNGRLNKGGTSDNAHYDFLGINAWLQCQSPHLIIFSYVRQASSMSEALTTRPRRLSGSAISNASYAAVCGCTTLVLPVVCAVVCACTTLMRAVISTDILRLCARAPAGGRRCAATRPSFSTRHQPRHEGTSRRPTRSHRYIFNRVSPIRDIMAFTSRTASIRRAGTCQATFRETVSP